MDGSEYIENKFQFLLKRKNTGSFHNKKHVVISIITSTVLFITVKEKKDGKYKVRIKWNEAYVRQEGGDPTVTEEIRVRNHLEPRYHLGP